MKAFPTKNVLNLLLTLAFAWLAFGGGGLPVIGTGPFMALLVEETADRNKLTAGQVDVITSYAPGSVRDYLKTHCSKDAAGNPEFRIVDQNTDMSQEPQKWQDAMRLPRASVPWLYVSNGTSGWGGPLPQTEAEALALLKKWGGQ